MSWIRIVSIYAVAVASVFGGGLCHAPRLVCLPGLASQNADSSCRDCCSEAGDAAKAAALLAAAPMARAVGDGGACMACVELPARSDASRPGGDSRLQNAPDCLRSAVTAPIAMFPASDPLAMLARDASLPVAQPLIPLVLRC
jgi:hypothetical protein